MYDSGSEDPPEYPAGSALRSPDGPLGAVVHPEITNNIPKAKNEQAAIRIRAAPADPDSDHELHHLDSSRLANPAEIVPPEIDKHHVLGALLGIRQQLSL